MHYAINVILSILFLSFLYIRFHEFYTFHSTILFQSFPLNVTHVGKGEIWECNWRLLHYVTQYIWKLVFDPHNLHCSIFGFQVTFPCTIIATTQSLLYSPIINLPDIFTSKLIHGRLFCIREHVYYDIFITRCILTSFYCFVIIYYCIL